jgi:hypothetical protein
VSVFWLTVLSTSVSAPVLQIPPPNAGSPAPAALPLLASLPSGAVTLLPATVTSSSV